MASPTCSKHSKPANLSSYPEKDGPLAGQFGFYCPSADPEAKNGRCQAQWFPNGTVKRPPFAQAAAVAPPAPVQAPGPGPSPIVLAGLSLNDTRAIAALEFAGRLYQGSPAPPSVALEGARLAYQFLLNPTAPIPNEVPF